MIWRQTIHEKSKKSAMTRRNKLLQYLFAWWHQCVRMMWKKCQQKSREASMTGLLLSGHFWCLQAYGKVGHLVIYIIKVQKSDLVSQSAVQEVSRNIFNSCLSLTLWLTVWHLRNDHILLMSISYWSKSVISSFIVKFNPYSWTFSHRNHHDDEVTDLETPLENVNVNLVEEFIFKSQTVRCNWATVFPETQKHTPGFFLQSHIAAKKPRAVRGVARGVLDTSLWCSCPAQFLTISIQFDAVVWQQTLLSDNAVVFCQQGSSMW